MKNLKKMLAALLLMVLTLSTFSVAYGEEAIPEETTVIEEQVEQVEQVEKVEKKAKKNKKNKKTKKEVQTEETAVEATEATEEAVEAEEGVEVKEEVVEVQEEVVEVVEVNEVVEAIETGEGSEMRFEEERVPMSSGIIDVNAIDIVINSNVSNPSIGDKVKLSAKLKTKQDLSGHKIKYQWQVDKGDGDGFRNIEKKGDKDTFSFKLAEKHSNYSWRVQIKVA